MFHGKGADEITDLVFEKVIEHYDEKEEQLSDRTNA